MATAAAAAVTSTSLAATTAINARRLPKATATQCSALPRLPPRFSRSRVSTFAKPFPGLEYSTKACCGHGGGNYNFDPQVFCGNTKVMNGVSVTASACEDPYKYVSWDGVHATEAANKLLTYAILNGSYSYPSFPLSNFCDLHPID